MLTFTNVNDNNCRENAVVSKRGRSELWDPNNNSNREDIGNENKGEDYEEIEDDNKNIDQASLEYPSLRRHAQHLT